MKITHLFTPLCIYIYIYMSILRFKHLHSHSSYKSQQQHKRSLLRFGGAKQLQHPDPAEVLLLGITASFENVLTGISAFIKHCVLHNVYNSPNVQLLSWSLVEELKSLLLTPESIK